MDGTELVLDGAVLHHFPDCLPQPYFVRVSTSQHPINGKLDFIARSLAGRAGLKNLEQDVNILPPAKQCVLPKEEQVL